MVPIIPQTIVHHSRRGYTPDIEERIDRYQDYLQEQALIAKEKCEQEADLEAQVQSALLFEAKKVAAQCEVEEERERVDEFEHLGLINKGTTTQDTEATFEDGQGDITHLLRKRKSSLSMQSSGNLTPKKHCGNHLFPKAQKAHLFCNLKFAMRERALNRSRSRRSPPLGSSSSPTILILSLLKGNIPKNPVGHSHGLVGLPLIRRKNHLEGESGRGH